MSKCFIAKREGIDSCRIYRLCGDYIVRIGSDSTKIPLDADDDPSSEIIEHEKDTWPGQGGSISIDSFDASVGTYYPSIARLIYPENSFKLPNAKDYIKLIKTVWREIEIVSKDLENCFNVTSPYTENFEAFGIGFEKIISFCCMGVESLPIKILQDNDLAEEDYNMNDFVKLKPHLKLDQYGLKLVRYPWIDEIFPFNDWSKSAPSQSLPWFFAYNSLKHDKRRNENRASLITAIQSACAYYTMGYAVFGGDFFPGFISDRFYFQFDSWPTWEPKEYYFQPEDDKWIPRNISL